MEEKITNFNNRPFNIMVFPNGPQCNLDCDYCYYLQKADLYPETDDFNLSLDLLEEYVKQYIEAQPGPVVQFGWQGGEPTLRGLDFFKKAVELENKYLPEGWQCQNSFQTNGLLLDADWCQFFKENNFLIGISLDGPAVLHDAYRKNKGANPSHSRVMAGLNLLKEYRVDFNILCVVNKINVKKPLAVYNFFKEIGAEYMQFIPLIEQEGAGGVSSRSISGKEYGKFLITIFDQWVRYDLVDIFVQIFEEAVSAWAGYGTSLCVFSETCGLATVMEHNGDIYACDHFVFPEYKLGNINENTIKEMVYSAKQEEFGLSKKTKLPQVCQDCNVNFICHGGCLRNRISQTETGEAGLNYLCAGYKTFFNYIRPYMVEIASRIKKRQSPTVIRREMKAIYDQIWDIGRNEPCPCGSGRKYKKCCLSIKN